MMKFYKTTEEALKDDPFADYRSFLGGALYARYIGGEIEILLRENEGLYWLPGEFVP